MKKITLSTTALLFISNLSNADTAKSKIDLESILICKYLPTAYETITYLLNEKIVSKTKLGIDSVSYFKVIKEIQIYNGYKVKYVIGHDENVSEKKYKKLFTRGPGTSPGNFIGIVLDTHLKEIASLKKLEKHSMNDEPYRQVIVNEDYLLGKDFTAIKCHGNSNIPDL